MSRCGSSRICSSSTSGRTAPLSTSPPTAALSDAQGRSTTTGPARRTSINATSVGRKSPQPTTKRSLTEANRLPAFTYPRRHCGDEGRGNLSCQTEPMSRCDTSRAGAGTTNLQGDVVNRWSRHPKPRQGPLPVQTLADPHKRPGCTESRTMPYLLALAARRSHFFAQRIAPARPLQHHRSQKSPNTL